MLTTSEAIRLLRLSQRAVDEHDGHDHCLIHQGRIVRPLPEHARRYAWR